MNVDDLKSRLAEIHNTIAAISVCGNDAIRMGHALTELREAIAILQDGIHPCESQD